MLTTYVLFIIIFIISRVSIRRKCKEEKKDFNPFEGNLLEALGFLFGFAVIVVGTIYLILKYLP